MGIIAKADGFLAGIAKRCACDKKYGLAVGVAIYTVLFLLLTLSAFLRILLDTGALLGGDGIASYYPWLLDLRRNVITFFEGLSHGEFKLTMINMDYSYGMDTITTMSMIFIPFFPVFALSALVPEAAVPTFFAVVTLLLAYLAGLCFIRLCRYFNLNLLWSSLFAVFYVFCDNFITTGVFNPAFLYMYIAFPLMIVGIDRIICGGSCVPFVLTVFWLATGGFTFPLYTIPFVVVFALVRVYFVHKGAYFRSLLRYFLRGCGATLLGFAMAGAFIIPNFMLIIGGDRAAIPEVDILSLLIPSTEYLAEAIGAGSPFSQTGIIDAVIPLLLCALCVVSRTELRVYSLIMIGLTAMPVIRFGLNGFQYDHARWGAASAMVMCFCCAACAPKLMRCSKRFLGKILFVLAVYTLLVTLYAAELAAVFAFVFAVLDCIPVVRRAGKKAAAALKKLISRIRRNSSLSLALAGFAVLVLFLLVLLVVLYRAYTINAVLLISAAVAVLILAVTKRARATVSVVLCAAVVMTGMAYVGDFTYPVYMLSEDPLLDYIEENYSGDPFDRIIDIYRDYSVYPITEENGEAAADSEEEPVPEQPEYLEDSKSNNIPLRYDITNPCVFNTAVNSSYMDFMRRCGMEWESVPSVVEVYGYSGKEAVYSLFGIDTLYHGYNTDYYYGYELIDSIPYKDDSVVYFYRNRYAMPAGVTYSDFMDKEAYEALNAAELPFAALDCMYAEGWEIPEGTDVSRREYSVECDVEHTQNLRGETRYGMECYDNILDITTDVSDCFLYLCFDGVNHVTHKEANSATFMVNVDERYTCEYIIHNSESSWEWKYSTDMYSFALGYQKEDINKLSFITPFMYDSMKLYAVPSSVYTTACGERMAETLEDVRCDVNTITGDITVSGDRMLSVNMLYSEGWTAYVDGEKTPLYKANGIFLGVPLEEGTHSVKLTYRTPWLYEGFAVTLAAWAVFAVIAVLARRKSKR